MLQYFITFLFIQGVLFTVELLKPVQHALIIPFTEAIATISGWIVRFFDHRVISKGIILRNSDNGFAVSIEAGCNGVEASIVLIAAIVAYPAPWINKLIGLIAGFFAIQALNLARIISLFYLGQWNQSVFEWAHLYIWQALIILDALIVFLIWLRTLPASAAAD